MRAQHHDATCFGSSHDLLAYVYVSSTGACANTWYDEMEASMSCIERALNGKDEGGLHSVPAPYSCAGHHVQGVHQKSRRPALGARTGQDIISESFKSRKPLTHLQSEKEDAEDAVDCTLKRAISALSLVETG